MGKRESSRSAAERIALVLMDVDGHIRTIANSKIDATGSTIKGGKFTSTGGDSPWQVRCR